MTRERIAMGLALAVSMVGCYVTRTTGSQLTGTCDGACAHYVECKPGHPEADRKRCLAECPDVFSERETLMEYESLTCDNAVEFVDGRTPRTAAQSR